MKMHYPKISIVTPSYNQGKYIEHTICSVLNQNYPNLEYIIIDGGSTDNTVDIIKKYQHKITYWVSEKDKGQTDAINKGFSKCTGDIFNWINSDDYYEPGVFDELAAMYNSNPEKDVFCGKEIAFNDADNSVIELNPGSIICDSVFETIRVGIIDQPCTFWKRAAIAPVFPLAENLHYVMDRQMWWYYLLKTGQEKIVCSSKTFTHFRLHPNSKSVSLAEKFELEFDRLKQSLFVQLDAPQVLLNQLHRNPEPLNINWEIALDKKYLLAAFAYPYAVRCYVKEDMKTARELMMLVKQWKGKDMNRAERKTYLLCCIVPKGLLFFFKKLKRSISN